MKVRFGSGERNSLSGAELYVRIFQITSLMTLPYIFIASGYPALVSYKNILSFIFDAGIMSLPRAEALLCGLIFKLTLHELIVYFLILIFAFVYGIVMKRLLTGPKKHPVIIRRILAVLICADVIFRAIPVKCNISFGWPALLIGEIIRLGCLFLIIKDLIAIRKEKNIQN